MSFTGKQKEWNTRGSCSFVQRERELQSYKAWMRAAASQSRARVPLALVPPSSLFHPTIDMCIRLQERGNKRNWFQKGESTKTLNKYKEIFGGGWKEYFIFFFFFSKYTAHMLYVHMACLNIIACFNYSFYWDLA